MLGILFALIGLTLMVWLLVKLREIRELTSGPPSDETTLIIGLFFAMSRASIRFYKERGRYPALVSGARDGLWELGYLKKESIASETAMIQLFSVVFSEKVGYGICLYNCNPTLTNSLLDRLEKTNSKIRFYNFIEDEFRPLARPITHAVALTLPLPTKPTSAEKKR